MSTDNNLETIEVVSSRSSILVYVILGIIFAAYVIDTYPLLKYYSVINQVLFAGVVLFCAWAIGQALRNAFIESLKINSEGIEYKNSNCHFKETWDNVAIDAPEGPLSAFAAGFFIKPYVVKITVLNADTAVGNTASFSQYGMSMRGTDLAKLLLEYKRLCSGMNKFVK
jgi:hypothetical protein